ncbi:MAG: hypothetical protein RhofKO_26310 [Rhodothermales bacterium]
MDLQNTVPRSSQSSPSQDDKAEQQDLVALINDLKAEIGLLRAHVEQPSNNTPLCLLDLKGVAHWLSVSQRTVEKLVASGELRPIRIRRSRRFDRSTIDAYLRAQYRKQHSK